MLRLDRTARRYGTRPSQLLGLRDYAQALDVDLTIAERCHQVEQDELTTLLNGESGGFFSAVIALLNRR